MAKPSFDNEQVQRDFLCVLRNTGSTGLALEAVNLHKSTLSRHRNKNSDFDQECTDAEQYYIIQQKIRRKAELKEAAYALTLRRIKSGEISDQALLKILFET